MIVRCVTAFFMNNINTYNLPCLTGSSVILTYIANTGVRVVNYEISLLCFRCEGKCD
jgi:hypothetical protein